ncbi:MAG: hypothetical protein R1F52_05130 [Candidatus Nitrosoabyssus spongiisocia]|nr:MAG: hypothetical protein R1F52_05130 [Nitrosopumilaceae archaeon AB1(1)]
MDTIPTRKQQAKQIMVEPNYASQIDTMMFKVKSQTDSNKVYTVSRTGNGLICTCLDHLYRKSNCKHIHVILDMIKINRGYKNNEFKIMERSKLNLCKYCSSGNMRKDSYHTTKQGKQQRFKCL